MRCFALIYRVSTVMHLCFVLFDVAEGCCCSHNATSLPIPCVIEHYHRGTLKRLVIQMVFCLQNAKERLGLGIFCLNV